MEPPKIVEVIKYYGPYSRESPIAFAMTTFPAGGWPLGVALGVAAPDLGALG